MITYYRIVLLLSGFQADEAHILKLFLAGSIFSISQGDLLMMGY